MNTQDPTAVDENLSRTEAPPEGEKPPDASQPLDDNKVDGVAAISVEERVKATIGRIEDRLVLVKSLIDGVDERIVFVDAAARILYANKKVRDNTGHSRDDMRGQPLDALNVVPAQSMPALLSHLNDLLSGQTVEPFKVEGRGESGETILTEIQLSPLSKGPQIIGARLTARSATEQVRVPEVSSGGQDRYRNLVENGLDWVWEVNEKNVYTYASAGVREVLGYEPREILGKSIFDFVPMAEANRVIKALGATITARQPLRMVQMNNTRKDGRTVTLETCAVPVLNAAGQFSGYQGVHRDITGRAQPDRRFGDELVKVERTVDGIIEAMSLVVEMRDPHTAGHQKRVAQLGGAIVREMHNLRTRTPDIDKRVRTAALLHDLGKMSIPTEVLTKPGQLTEDEFAAIKNHPRAGYDVLKKIEFPWPVADVVLQHHERLDGSGYPSGLKGDQICIEARIIAVADVVEAMVHPRSYRPALTEDAALREVAKGKKVLYDLEVVEACLAAFLDRGFKFRTE